MKNGITYALAVLALVAGTFQSCSKDDDSVVKGCKDPNATNYNPNATSDDGNCVYVSDTFAGNYIATDTITYTDPNTGIFVTSVESYSFSVAKVDNNSVLVSNFSGCSMMDATVTATYLTFTDPGNQCNIGNFVSSFNGQHLRYTYVRGAGVAQFISGRAVKQ